MKYKCLYEELLQLVIGRSYMSKQESSLLVQLLDELKIVEKNLLVKKDRNLYKNLKKYFNLKSKIANNNKEKE